ncbi:MAG: peptidyl-prolyl cis-trans isomerase, partial [Puniceicoccales bacterium]|nr:peptidyl-prolyl cis-trans isomerase [Puniceicoccales bacterium]
NLSAPKEVEQLQREAAFSLHFSGLAEGVPLERAMMARAAWLWVARRLQVPNPGQEELDGFLRSRPAFCEPDGQFSEKRYREFFDALREQAPELEPFIARTLAGDWRISRVADILSSADFSLPAEALLWVRQLRTRWTLAGVTLHFDDFNPSIAVDEGELEDFFEEHRETFRLPARVRVDYVYFPKCLNEVSQPTEEQLLDYLPPGSEEERRKILRERADEVRSAYVSAAAEQIVRARADEFLYRLHGAGEAPTREKIAAAADEFGLKVQSLEPVYENVLEEGDGPLPLNVLAAAFELNDEHSVSYPVYVDDGAYVLLLQERNEARDRAFWEVRRDAEEYYRARRRIELFANWAKDLRKQLLESLSSGENFKKAADRLGFETHNPISFTLKELPSEIPAGRVGAFLSLKKGDLSDFLLHQMDLQLWFVVDRQEPELATDDEEVIATAAAIRTAAGPTFLRQFIEELIRGELER